MRLPIRESTLRVCTAVLALVALASCEHHDSGKTPDAAVMDATPEASSRPRLLPSQIPQDYECRPEIEYLVRDVFETSCGWDTCHGDNDAAWGLRLIGDPQTVFAQLTTENAGICRGWRLVEPGEPEASFLLNKLSGNPACGEPMPRGVEPLPDVALNCVTQWILELK